MLLQYVFKCRADFAFAGPSVAGRMADVANLRVNAALPLGETLLALHVTSWAKTWSAIGFGDYG